METLNEREKSILKFVYEQIEQNGYSPSIREIGKAVGLTSTATIHSYLQKLREKGYIQKEDKKGRTLNLTEREKEKKKELMLKEIYKNAPKDFKKLSDTCYMFNGLYLELRSESFYVDFEEKYNELDCVIFETENDMNTDYDLRIDLYIETIKNAKSFWENVRQKMINTTIWWENQKEKNKKATLDNILKVVLHNRFKNLQQICEKISSQENVKNVNINQGKGNIVCDDYLIGEIEFICNDEIVHFDYQLFYIKDKLKQYYITEIEILEEVF